MKIETLRENEERYFYADDVKQAIRLNEQILLINPKDSKAVHNIGACYFKQGDFKTAIGYFEKALKLEPDSKETAYMLNLSKEYNKKSVERDILNNLLEHRKVTRL